MSYPYEKWSALWERVSAMPDWKANTDWTSEAGIDYASFIGEPLRPAFNLQKYSDELEERWFEGATTVQSMWEVAFWLGRSGEDDEPTGAAIMQAYAEAEAVSPTWVTEEIALRAIQHGYQFGSITATWGFNVIWAVWNQYKCWQLPAGTVQS